MSVELHITRAQYWFDGEKSPITLEEWLAYVGSASDLELDTDRGDGRALYLGPTLNNPLPLIYWQLGNLVSTCPDTLLYRKMLLIAEDLGARVQDEDDKTYSDPGQWSYDPDSQWKRREAAIAEAEAIRKKRGRRPKNRPAVREKILKEIASLTLDIMPEGCAEAGIEATIDGSNAEFSAWCRDESGDKGKLSLPSQLEEWFKRLRGFAADDETRYWTGCSFQINASGDFKVEFSYS